MSPPVKDNLNPFEPIVMSVKNLQFEIVLKPLLGYLLKGKSSPPSFIFGPANRLLDFLNEPRTMAEIVNQWIVYQRPREPQEFYALTEEMIMQKHLDLLVFNSMVVKEGERYRRI